MGPSDKAVEDVLYQKSVLGRAGNVKELKAAYLVRCFACRGAVSHLWLGARRLG